MNDRIHKYINHIAEIILSDNGNVSEEAIKYLKEIIDLCPKSELSCLVTKDILYSLIYSIYHNRRSPFDKFIQEKASALLEKIKGDVGNRFFYTTIVDDLINEKNDLIHNYVCLYLNNSFVKEKEDPDLACFLCKELVKQIGFINDDIIRREYTTISNKRFIDQCSVIFNRFFLSSNIAYSLALNIVSKSWKNKNHDNIEETKLIIKALEFLTFFYKEKAVEDIFLGIETDNISLVKIKLEFLKRSILDLLAVNHPEKGAENECK